MMSRLCCLLLLSVACGESRPSAGPDAGPDAGPGGPVKVLQVFVSELVEGDDGTVRYDEQLAWGDHPDIPIVEDDRSVDRAISRSPRVRVVFDRPLPASDFEEVYCVDGSYDHVAPDATLEDMIRCSPPTNESCEVVCADSEPPGFVDDYRDADPDFTRFSESAVTVACDDQRPVSFESSFETGYDDSVSQGLGEGGDPAGLGPAVVIDFEAFKAGSLCRVDFGEHLTDAEGPRLTAPSEPIEFRVEPFRLEVSHTSITRQGTPAVFKFNAAIDPVSAGVATSVQGPKGDFAITTVVSEDDPGFLFVEPEGPWVPGARYTLTIAAGPEGLLDRYGAELDEPIELEIEVADPLEQPGG